MTTPLPEVPPPPSYCDAAFTWTANGFRIDFKAEDPHRLGIRLVVIAGLIGVPGFILTAASIGLLSSGLNTAWLLLALGACLTLGGLLCFIPALMSKVMRSTIIFDGDRLDVGYPARRFSGYRFPIADLEGLRLYSTGKKELDLHFNAPRGECLARRVPHHLEVVTREGVIRVLSNWREQDLRWAVAVVNAIIGLDPLPDRDDAATGAKPAAVETGWTLQTRQRWGLGIPTALVVAAILLWMGNDLRHLIRINAWPAADGVVEAAEWVPKGDSGQLELRYRFVVEGTTYTGERLGYTTSPATESVFAHSHRAGAAVTVYYDPNDPSDAVLVREKPLLDWIVQGFLLMLVLLPFLWALHGGGNATKRELARKYGSP